MLNLAIHNGMVVDGTGSPGFRASVLVKDNQITIHRATTPALRQHIPSTPEARSYARDSLISTPTLD